MRSTPLRAAVLCALSVLGTWCKPGRRLTDPNLRARSESFNDHTVPRIEDASAFQRLARNEGLLRAVKFIITDFNAPERRRLRFYDSDFFKLHDEWYWFRLLNGVLVDGDDVEPVQIRPFANIPDIYQWAAEQAEYPLDLVMYSDGRLYSPRFYDRAFGRARRFGLGTLLSLPPAQGSSARRWAFELEFNDGATHEELMVFFAQLRAKLPAEIANDLHYLVRSQPQEALAQQMIRGQLTEHQRILRYDQIVPAGTREVYSEGITAGYLRFVRANEGLPMSTPEQILVFERSRDLLPPAAGVITAVPQTPLAHINLLARNRGIPNAMLAGALEDPMLMQFARGYAAVVFAANVTNGASNVSVAALTEEQMQRYRSMIERSPRRVNTADPARIPYVLDLSQQAPTQIPQFAASIGGKATGFIALTHTPGLAMARAPRRSAAPPSPRAQASAHARARLARARRGRRALAGASRGDRARPSRRASALRRQRGPWLDHDRAPAGFYGSDDASRRGLQRGADGRRGDARARRGALVGDRDDGHGAARALAVHERARAVGRDVDAARAAAIRRRSRRVRRARDRGDLSRSALGDGHGAVPNRAALLYASRLPREHSRRADAGAIASFSQ